MKSNSSVQISSEKDSLNTNHISKKISPSPFTDDHLALENVLVNGNDIILSKAKFGKIYPKHDSVKTELWECGSAFDWLDKEWMEKTYGKDLVNFDGKITTFYVNHAEFNSDNHIILFSQAQADKNDFEIKSHHITLNKNTTINKFQKLFPKLKKDETDQKNVVSFRIPVAKDGEDSFIFYFKDGKLESFYLWWLLC
ncbi:hypothetical protein ACFOEQ_16420 [Chryseobacterium arachidis]